MGMRKIAIAALAASSLLGGVMSEPAFAQQQGIRKPPVAGVARAGRPPGGGGGGGQFARRRGGGRGVGVGGAIAAGVAGAVIGGIIAGQSRGPYDEPAPYQAYPAPYPAYGAPYPAAAPVYVDPGSYAPPPGTPEWYDYCARRYRSFDPASGTFLGYDGRRYACQ